MIQAARRKNRRASTCHRERAAQPGAERSKSAKPSDTTPPPRTSTRILKGLRNSSQRYPRHCLRSVLSVGIRGEVFGFRSPDSPITGSPDLGALRAPPLLPPGSSQIGVDFRGCHPSSSQIGVGFIDLASTGVEFRATLRSFAPLRKGSV
jgi:hypothetical protein